MPTHSDSPDFIDRHRTSIGLSLVAVIISGSLVSLYTINAQNQTPKIALHKGGSQAQIQGETAPLNQKESAVSEESVAGTKIFSQVNINTASIDDLVAANLYRIGYKTAEKIVEYRQQNGPFKSIEEIMEVKGIGEKTFEKIKDKITVE